MPANPASPYLSERLIARLSPLRRANLERRTRDHFYYASEGCDATGNVVAEGHTDHYGRCERVLGRLSALTA
jgi:hypothetical protein